MKARDKFLYPVLFCAVVTAPYMAHSVTLGSALKTPCLFGALGTRVTCPAPTEQAGNMRPGFAPNRGGSVTAAATGEAPVAPPAEAPATLTVETGSSDTANTAEIQDTTSEATLDTPPSEKVADLDMKNKLEEMQHMKEMRAVPLPLGGLLLLSSIGLMFLANRRRRR